LQINPAASPKTIGAVKALYDRITVGKINPITGDVVKAPLSVPEVDGFRRLLGGTAGEDAAASGAIRSTIDDFLNKLDETKFATGGPEAVSKLNAARATATRNFKMQKFSDMVKNADGNPAKIQKAAFNFLKDDANLAGLSPEAIAALKNVRDGFGAQKALQFLGRLGFDQNSAWGPAVLGLVGGAPVTIPATAARYANKLAVRGAAKTALDSLSPQQAGKMSPSEVVSALRAQMKKGNSSVIKNLAKDESGAVGSARYNTPEFKSWSGGAPVVSRKEAPSYDFKTGKPVVVEGLHGTRSGDFNEFRDFAAEEFNESPAFFFGNKGETASSYAEANLTANDAPNVIPAHLRMENPLVVDAKGSSYRDIPYNNGKFTSDYISAKAASSGHDGVIIRNVRDDFSSSKTRAPSDVYVVFSPTQIKSIHNAGTYSKTDPNILRGTGIALPAAGLGAAGYYQTNEGK